MKQYDINHDMRYLQLLAQSFPSIAEASTEIINLQAILNLPKGTEHFLADIHGEYEAFLHVLKNASGNIKRKVNELFGNTLREQDKRELCTLIYYPEQKLEQVKQRESDIDDWYHITLHQLVAVAADGLVRFGLVGAGRERDEIGHCKALVEAHGLPSPLAQAIAVDRHLAPAARNPG